MSVGNNVAYGFGVFLILSGIIIGFSWPVLFDYISKEKLQLSPSSDTFQLWVKTPLPMYMEIYLFNWTNSAEFLKNKKLKPEFEEVGPFVFKEVHQRVNITWNDNDTVSYNQVRTWTFVPEESLDLSTPINNLNVIATTVANVASYYPTKMKVLLDILYYRYHEKLIIRRSAREWLFEGMDDKLLDFLKTIPTNTPIPFDKFGWFYGRNLSSTFDGRFNVKTGGDNIFDLGAMREWNYVNKTQYYKGECGVVNGSSGELFAPIRNEQDGLSIFITDFCGQLKLKYSGRTTVEGLEGDHFIGDESVFDDGSKYPEAKCYCSGECSPSGVRNVTTCRIAPLHISFPHFYLADPVYTQSVGGMKPNKSEHEFYLSIHPLTGIPLEVRAQLQLNILLRPLSWCPMFVNVPKVYVPMMWFRQRVKVTPELASRGEQLRIFGKMGLGLACGLALLGVLVIIIRLCVVTIQSRLKKTEGLITQEVKEDGSESGGS